MCGRLFVGFDEPDNSRRHNGQLIVIMKNFWNEKNLRHCFKDKTIKFMKSLLDLKFIESRI